MAKRLSVDARRQVITSAAEEAHRRGDRRVGTDHLLLGLLDEPDSVAERLLGVDLASARATSAALDRAALAAVGIDVASVDPPMPIRTRRRPPFTWRLPFTSGARAVLERSVHEAHSEKARSIEARHLLLGVLARKRPDPAAELLAALGVDPAEARDRLTHPAN
jgi:ATP-dependent Clp protease ATP-binding subunit ClpA